MSRQGQGFNLSTLFPKIASLAQIAEIFAISPKDILFWWDMPETLTSQFFHNFFPVHRLPFQFLRAHFGADFAAYPRFDLFRDLTPR